MLFSEKILVISIRGFLTLIVITLCALVLYCYSLFYYQTLNWRSNKQAIAYTTKIITEAKAEREADLIKQGLLPFCTTNNYDGCGIDNLSLDEQSPVEDLD